MKRLAIGLTAALATWAGSMAIASAADFGSPPSGAVPLLYNDHHVYTKPSTLKANRMLGALVRGSTILVPLRSMFEEMGATVSFDAKTKTVDVTKPGSDIRLTVGKPVAIINGEQRPLDVPPEMYQGTLLVPVRVISETMGAYVEWVQDKHVVVVRYLPPATPAPATPEPTPTEAPTPEPVATPAPTPPPTPTPAPTAKSEAYIMGGGLFGTKVYNEFSNGNKGNTSYEGSAAIEFPAFGLPWMVSGDLDQWKYNTTAGPVEVIGNTGSTVVPSFTANDTDVSGHFGLKIADPRIYVAVAGLRRTTNYGYPAQTGIGFGAEKLPDVDQPFSVFGSVYYYPSIKGNYNGLSVAYRDLLYKVGLTYDLLQTPIFLNAGFMGDKGTSFNAAPGPGFTHNGFFVGIGAHI